MNKVFSYIGMYWTSTSLIGGTMAYFEFKDYPNKNMRNTAIILNACVSPLIPIEYIDKKINKLFYGSK